MGQSQAAFMLAVYARALYIYLGQLALFYKLFLYAALLQAIHRPEISCPFAGA